nr:EAL domain-containing protein [Noviherbaspirillum saxi]
MEYASSLAGEVIRHAEVAGDEMDRAVTALQSNTNSGPCADAKIRLMRELALSSRYLQGIGYVSNDYLLCSSYGFHGKEISLGRPDHIGKNGDAVRASVNLPMAKNKTFLLVERKGYVVIIHRDLAIDVFLNDPDIAIGIFSTISHNLNARRGSFDPAWITRLSASRNRPFFDGQFIVAARPSAKLGITAYAAIPGNRLAPRVRQLTWLLGSLGAASGLVVMGALWYVAKQRLSVRSLLKSALKTSEIYMVYQPVVNLSTREWIGAEALVRWRRPDGSDIRPDIFIPIAEETGLIQQMTLRIMETVAHDSVGILKKNPRFHIGMNLSGIDLESNTIIETLQRLLEHGHLRANNLLLEATERTLLKAHLANQVLSDIRSMGIAVAIDDFGTGYSSLSYLTELKFDYLKIDKSFVDTIGTNSATSHVIFHIIKMAQSLKLSIIAEGVESEHQARFLEQHGVQFAQGWLFAKPMLVADLVDHIHR